MEFAYITDLTDLDTLAVLVKLFNLLLTCLYTFLLYIGYKTIIRVLRKGVFKWKL